MTESKMALLAAAAAMGVLGSLIGGGLVSWRAQGVIQNELVNIRTTITQQKDDFADHETSDSHPKLRERLARVEMESGTQSNATGARVDAQENLYQAEIRGLRSLIEEKFNNLEDDIGRLEDRLDQKRSNE